MKKTKAYKIIKANISTIILCGIAIALIATSIKSITNIINKNDSETNNTLIDIIEIQPYKIAYKVSDKDPYRGEFTADMDLLNRTDITEMDMNKILNYYTKYKENENSIFKNKGYLFCDVANKTGLDPIFIMSIAVSTYGWSYSTNDVELVDYTDAEKQFENDVLNMATWIYRNYYVNRSCHTLNDMINVENYKYATSEEWADTIAFIMDRSYKIILMEE